MRRFKQARSASMLLNIPIPGKTRFWQTPRLDHIRVGNTRFFVKWRVRWIQQVTLLPRTFLNSGRA